MRSWNRYLAIGALLATGFGAGAAGAWWFHAQVQSGTSLVYLDEGQNAIKDREYVQAIASLNRAVYADPKSWLACMALANAYDLNKNNDLAIRQYRDCLVMSEVAHMDVEQRTIKKKIADLTKETDGQPSP